jgi:uncharacterized protein
MIIMIVANPHLVRRTAAGPSSGRCVMDSSTQSPPAPAAARRRALRFLAVAPLGALLLLTGAQPGWSGEGRVAAAWQAEFATEDATLAALEAAIDEALAANQVVTIDWRLLAGLNYRNGQVSEALQKVDGKQVRIPGFIVPLEDYMEEAAEFLLVPYYGACIHTPPPPPNQMVHVVMENNRKARTGWWEPIWMEGKLDIKNIDSPYGSVGFQISGRRVTPYEY